MEDLLLDLNKKFSLEAYAQLKRSQTVVYKNNLKQTIGNLKGRHTLKVLDDDYLFSLAASRANYSMMEMVNEYREIVFKQNHTRDDQKQTSLLQQRKHDLRRKMLVALFGAYVLFYSVDQSTIALNPEILNTIIG